MESLFIQLLDDVSISIKKKIWPLWLFFWSSFSHLWMLCVRVCVCIYIYIYIYIYTHTDLPTCTHFDLKVCWYNLSLWTTQNPGYASVQTQYWNKQQKNKKSSTNQSVLFRFCI